MKSFLLEEKTRSKWGFLTSPRWQACSSNRPANLRWFLGSTTLLSLFSGAYSEDLCRRTMEWMQNSLCLQLQWLLNSHISPYRALAFIQSFSGIIFLTCMEASFPSCGLPYINQHSHFTSTWKCLPFLGLQMGLSPYDLTSQSLKKSYGFCRLSVFCTLRKNQKSFILIYIVI